MFSSASGGTNGANLDIDLQDIFSDYFLEEFNPSTASNPFASSGPTGVAPNSTGPLSSSPLMMDSGMMPPQPVLADPSNPPRLSGQQQPQTSVAQQPTNPKRTSGISLPTGKGITTSWHLGSMPSMSSMSSSRPSPLPSQTPLPIPPPPQQTSKRKYSDEDDDTAESAVAERRLRNREHAKRSRVRKKFMLESLQEEVRVLQGENTQLRLKIQRCLPTKAQRIFQECCSSSELFNDGGLAEEGVEKKVNVDKEVESDGRSKSTLDHSDYNLISSLTTGQQNFCLSDPRLPDNPIVFASEGFYSLTGYTPQQVLGRNCRFLQGPGTDPAAVDVVRRAIENGTDATVCLLNYRADGTPFWNQFFVAALRDEHNEIVNYVGVQCPVEPVNAQELLERKVNEVLPLK